VVTARRKRTTCRQYGVRYPGLALHTIQISTSWHIGAREALLVSTRDRVRRLHGPGNRNQLRDGTSLPFGPPRPTRTGAPRPSSNLRPASSDFSSRGWRLPVPASCVCHENVNHRPGTPRRPDPPVIAVDRSTQRTMPGRRPVYKGLTLVTTPAGKSYTRATPFGR